MMHLFIKRILSPILIAARSGKNGAGCADMGNAAISYSGQNSPAQGLGN
ncbi:hypothetical protein JWJ88_09325 [Paracoccus methylovorus]|uniref:Uncharacterized protein n=1 Tax=Paracoccus methylovorus TaxID=2812658 RepID=A0ABX7JIV4_9RHOB|nr:MULTISPECIES: hypothetical protein [Paracoccus]QRZ12804.1 hypothetical protein JWJ88_09325 [Paracoccus methylovorus]